MKAFAAKTLLVWSVVTTTTVISIVLVRTAVNRGVRETVSDNPVASRPSRANPDLASAARDLLRDVLWADERYRLQTGRAPTALRDLQDIVIPAPKSDVKTKPFVVPSEPSAEYFPDAPTHTRVRVEERLLACVPDPERVGSVLAVFCDGQIRSLTPEEVKRYRELTVPLP